MAGFKLILNNAPLRIYHIVHYKRIILLIHTYNYCRILTFIYTSKYNYTDYFIFESDREFITVCEFVAYAYTIF